MATEYSPRYVAPPQHKRTVMNRAVDWISGEYPSGKPAMNYRMVRYDGMLSRSLLLMLEADPAVLSYWEEPTPFKWTDGIAPRLFKPTYAVDLADGRHIAVKVGRVERLVREVGALSLIQAAAPRHGYQGVELWTEDDLDHPVELANADLLGKERGFVTDEADLHRMRLAFERLGRRATVRELRRASALGDRSYRSVVRLVALGEFCLARTDKPLDDNAVVEGALRH